MGVQVMFVVSGVITEVSRPPPPSSFARSFCLQRRRYVIANGPASACAKRLGDFGSRPHVRGGQ